MTNQITMKELFQEFYDDEVKKQGSKIVRFYKGKESMRLSL